jgi:molybdopterin-guanine dinucleotide biosynthesis protein B
MIPILSIVGASSVGKTTVLEKLIAELTQRGYKIAAIKHCAHDFEIDHEGRDTYRLRQAGAAAVIAASPQKFALVQEGGLDLEALATFYLNGVNLIFTEGYKNSSVPKIEVLRHGVNTVPLINDDKLFALVTDVPIPRDVPRFGFDEISQLASLIEKTFLAKIETHQVIELSVDGHSIPMLPFVQNLLRNTIRAMIHSLKGTDGGKEIRIFLREP